MAEQLQAVVGQLLGEIENVDSLSNLDTLAFKAALAWKNYKDTQDQVWPSKDVLHIIVADRVGIADRVGMSVYRVGIADRVGMSVYRVGIADRVGMSVYCIDFHHG